MKSEAISKAVKRRWRDPEAREKLIEGARRGAEERWQRDRDPKVEAVYVAAFRSAGIGRGALSTAARDARERLRAMGVDHPFSLAYLNIIRVRRRLRRRGEAK